MIAAILCATLVCWCFYEQEGVWGCLLAAVISATLLLGATQAHASVPLPPRFQFIAGPCPDNPSSGDTGGCSFPDGRVYLLDDVFHPAHWIRAHELGHVFDSELLSAYDHHRFSRLANVYGPWGGPDVDADGYSSGPLSEDFADAYGACLLNVAPDRWSGYGYDPSLRLHRRVCAWIRRVAAR